MRIEDEIRSMRKRDDDLSKLKLDVIRVLAIFNGVSWMTEIIPDILKLRGGIPDYALREELLDEAIRDLESDEVILVEPRSRGMPFSREVHEDKLIRLRDLSAARKALAGEMVYLSYLRGQMEAIRRALESRE
ncbi:MAG: hypothetical protein QXU12_03460 [Nitrososphaerota archaeon]